MELTKSAKKSLAILYKEYCQRVKSGVCKADARRIRAGEYPEELLDDLKELREAGAVKVDIGKNVDLENKAIIYMENLPADTIKGWLSFLQIKSNSLHFLFRIAVRV